jgi:hypothetical protein
MIVERWLVNHEARKERTEMTRHTWNTVVGLCLCVVLGIGLTLMKGSSSSVPRRYVPDAPIVHQESVSEVVERHLGWADQQDSAGLAPRLLPVRAFFSDARRGTRQFAEDALGWKSKWKLISDYVSGEKEHAKFLKRQFSARIFSAEQLEQVIEASVAAYLRHLDDVDAQLVVNLQSDLLGASPGQLPASVDRQAIREVLDAAIHDALQNVEADFRGTVGRQLVSFVASEVLTAASVELAISAGILGAGAVSAPMTLGVGFIVAFFVDFLVNWAYDEIYDPLGELSSQLDRKLTQLEDFILIGTSAHPGLEARLHDYALRRGQARNLWIKSAVTP